MPHVILPYFIFIRNQTIIQTFSSIFLKLSLPIKCSVVVVGWFSCVIWLFCLWLFSCAFLLLLSNSCTLPFLHRAHTVSKWSSIRSMQVHVSVSHNKLQIYYRQQNWNRWLFFSLFIFASSCLIQMNGLIKTSHCIQQNVMELANEKKYLWHSSEKRKTANTEKSEPSVLWERKRARFRY